MKIVQITTISGGEDIPCKKHHPQSPTQRPSKLTAPKQTGSPCSSYGVKPSPTPPSSRPPSPSSASSSATSHAPTTAAPPVPGRPTATSGRTRTASSRPTTTRRRARRSWATTAASGASYPRHHRPRTPSCGPRRWPSSTTRGAIVRRRPACLRWRITCPSRKPTGRGGVRLPGLRERE